MRSYYSGHVDQKFGNIFYSQNGEDIIILNIFDSIRVEKPSYLDIGAHHPSRISNTKLLYERGSRGVNIEANPYLIGEFADQRPLDKNVCVGVNRFETGISREEFYMYDEWSGRNTFSYNEYENCVQEFGMKMMKCLAIDCMSINDIVKEYCNGKWPDFLNCDIEGLDFDVMQSAHWGEQKPKVICIETTKCPDVINLICRRGYTDFMHLGDNSIFVDESL